MVVKPRIVIIGAGMAGLTAANKLYRNGASKELFELCVVEGGNRIGGRINTSELGGDRIEMGATWIHGIIGSPIHEIAQEIHSLESQQPWECMDGYPHDHVYIAENGYILNPSIVAPLSTLFNKLMDFAQGNATEDGIGSIKDDTGTEKLSVGSFLRKGLEVYCDSQKDQDDVKGYGNWSSKLLEEAIFAMHENFHRAYTAANDLSSLDYKGESELDMFPGEHITIAKGYSTIIESLASVLPTGLIHLGRKVSRIEWQPQSRETENRVGPVMLYFDDDTTMYADHVIVTVSLGVLKAGISENSGMFNPPLPNYKTEAISRFGFGVVDKLFLQLSPTNFKEEGHFCEFPSLRLVFHQHDSKLRQPEIPWWMRRTASCYPIYRKSRVLVTWFAGEEALALESINVDNILAGVSTTLSSFLANSQYQENSNSHEHIQSGNSVGSSYGYKLRFDKVLKSQWGTDPLFLGSYSYIAVGSSADDADIMAEPLPKVSASGSGTSPPPLQILFAGEATHRNHFSTTHGAYLSGLREASRLLQHYNCIDV